MHKTPCPCLVASKKQEHCPKAIDRFSRCQMMHKRLTGAIMIACALARAAAQQTPPRPSAMAPEGITPIALGLAGYAKVLCSAVFVSGREPAEAFTNSGYFLLEDEQRVGVTYAID